MAMKPQQTRTIANSAFNPPSSLQIPMSTNTVIVFDFDDTLFPTKRIRAIQSRTTFKNTLNYSKPNFESLVSKMTSMELSELIHLSWCLFNLLRHYIQKYSTQSICIVSASSEGWLEQAFKSVHDIGYFREVYHLIYNQKVMNHQRISIFNPTAGATQSFKIKKRYKTHSEHPCFHWKYMVFDYIFQKKYVDSMNVINTFVFIGDSEFEYLAANKLRIKVEKNKNVIIDRIKLIHNPSIAALIDEQKWLYSKCGYYENYSRNNKCGFDVDYIKEIEKQSASQNEMFNRYQKQIRDQMHPK